MIPLLGLLIKQIIRDLTGSLLVSVPGHAIGSWVRDQARTQHTVGIREWGLREGSFAAAWPQANQHHLYPWGEQRPVGWVSTYSAVVMEYWGLTGMGLWGGECLCMLPKAEAAPHVVLCLKYACLSIKDLDVVGPFVHPHLPSPSFHNSNICV